jgi:Flp pilus assembly protein TadG
LAILRVGSHMKDLFVFIQKLFRKHTHQRKEKRGAGAQSLVEFAIALPIIILLFSGLIEFGFALNYYLSLLDATREAARFYSNSDPFNADLSDNMLFYQGAADMVISNLQPRDLGATVVTDNTRKIILDPNADDVIVSVFNVDSGVLTRYPTSTSTPGEYRFYGNHPSRIQNQDVSNHLVAGAPNTALVLVEVFYSYHQILALPWLTVFVGDPILLHAYTMFPMPPISFTGEPQPLECTMFGEGLPTCNINAALGRLTTPAAALEEPHQ